MVSKEMYLDATGGWDTYRLNGTKLLFIGTLVLGMFSASSLSSFATRIHPAMGIVLGILIAIAQFVAPFYPPWAMLRKAHGFWDSLRNQWGMKIPDTGKSLLRLYPFFYAGTVAVTLLSAVGIAISLFVGGIYDITEMSMLIVIPGAIGLTICMCSWLIILPLYVWRKLMTSTQAICWQIGYHLDDLVEGRGGWFLFGTGVEVILFWTIFIFFQPLRLMFRAIKCHDALIALLNTSTAFIPEEAG